MVYIFINTLTGESITRNATINELKVRSKEMGDMFADMERLVYQNPWRGVLHQVEDGTVLDGVLGTKWRTYDEREKSPEEGLSIGCSCGTLRRILPSYIQRGRGRLM